MSSADPSSALREFIEERWAVIQPKLFPGHLDVRVRYEDVTPREAEWFLASVTAHGDDPPLFTVGDDNKVPSRRCPPNADGRQRGGSFFERFGDTCILRLETIIHMAATWRLHDEFEWPLDRLIIESPDVAGADIALTREALDILVLHEPCTTLRSKIAASPEGTDLKVQVGAEVKADRKLLDKLIQGMRHCHGQSEGRHKTTDHKKCLALDVFRPTLFLGVAAGETWRLFRVDADEARTVIGAELNDLRSLSSRAALSV